VSCQLYPRLSVLHAVDTLHPSAGGPPRVVVQISDALSHIPGVDVTLVCQVYQSEGAVCSTSPTVTRRDMKSRSRVAVALGLPARAGYRSSLAHTTRTVVHNHGLWCAANHWAARFAREAHVPLVLQPHGMLEPWALQHRRAKKSLAMALYQRKDLQQANLLIATAEEEYQTLRSLGLRNPIAVIPNGVELPHTDRRQSERSGARTRTALFLSRVHAKKGLLNLIKAWSAVRPTGWRLQIAGPDEGGHLVQVMREAELAGIQDVIEYVGEVEGLHKARAFSDADLFVLPTFSENFGVAVAEAMSYGLPVITTRGAPWSALASHGCGWWIDIGVDPLARCLSEATALPDRDREEMGCRGREYVQRFAWPTIAQQTADTYQWLLRTGPKPEFVHLD
jgi:glycosyltransferase involved in cell wall biosynthesis